VVRVKICGITSTHDALLAVECGADAVGFVFADSPRRIGVFVNAPQEIVVDALTSFLDYAQLHGEESVSLCEVLAKRHGSRRIIKVFRVHDLSDLSALEHYKDVTGMFHLDTRVPDAAGGTGQTFDWAIAVEAKRWGKPVVLSGGLTPDNVADAVAEVQPYAVDASSGVESAPGKKDAKKVRDFVKRAKQVVTG
jgi:phosphoribosylanthranilate isomerase